MSNWNEKAKPIPLERLTFDRRIACDFVLHVSYGGGGWSARLRKDGTPHLGGLVQRLASRGVTKGQLLELADEAILPPVKKYLETKQANLESTRKNILALEEKAEEFSCAVLAAEELLVDAEDLMEREQEDE